MKINIDYKINIEKNNKELKLNNLDLIENKDDYYSDLTMQYIQMGVNLKYKDGLEGQKRRILGRIRRKVDAAIEDKTYNIELEKAEVDFINSVCNMDTKYPPQSTEYVCIFEDEFIDKMNEKPASEEIINKE